MPPKGLHIDRFIKGLVTNRAAITTPYRVNGLGSVIQYRDALIDGSNMEITPSNTLARRPGWTKYSSASYSGTANGLAGCNLSSTLHVLLSTTSNVYDVGTGAITSIYSKGTTNQTYFQQVGNYEYFSDGNANKKWDGTTVTNNGIVAPTSAPTVPNLNLYDTVGAAQTTHAWVPGATYTNSTASAQTYYLLAPTNEIYSTILPANATLTSQSSAPNWSSQFGVVGGTVTDGGLTWTNNGPIGTWQANKGSGTYFNSGYVHPGSFTAIAAPGTVGTSGSSAIANWVTGAPGEAHTANGTGTGSSNILQLTNFGFAIPTGSTITGIIVSFQANASEAGTTTDHNVQLLKAGVATGSGKTQGQWFYSLNNSTFATRNYGSGTDLWGGTFAPADINNSGFGVEIQFDLATSKLVGAVVQTTQITVYYTVGSWSGQFTASYILDPVTNTLQRVKVLGTTGGSAPAFSTTIGATTADNTMTWECMGTGNQLPILFSDTYAYGFRTTSAHISTMSPTLLVTAPVLGTSVAVKGAGSDDTQCTTVELYRTVDGGSLLLFDQSTPNVNSSTSWTILDTTLDASLNFLLVGPVAHANDPPPAGITVLAYHMGRMWGLVGNLLYFSAGPDCTNGDGNQAWPPANVFTLSAPGNALAPTTQGLVVETGIDVSAVLGGPQLNTFWVQPIFKNLGVQSANALTQDGDDVLMFTSQQQFISMSASGRNELGHDVAPTLAANFTASGAYLAVHRAGQDQGVFISDGSSKVMRFNMNAESWDPIGTPGVGAGPLASVDTAIGTRRLLMASGGSVYFRDVNTFSDNGTAFSAFATVGSIVLSELGEQPASLKSFALASAAVGSALTVAVLPNEISGSFVTIPKSNSDPAKLSGTAYASSTINMDEYQWLGVQTPQPNILRHFQLKITLNASDTVKNEIFQIGLI